MTEGLCHKSGIVYEVHTQELYIGRVVLDKGDK